MNSGIDVLRRVFFQSDDRRAKHANPVLLQLTDQRVDIRAAELGVLRVLAFHAHLNSRDTQPHKAEERSDCRLRLEQVGARGYFRRASERPPGTSNGNNPVG